MILKNWYLFWVIWDFGRRNVSIMGVYFVIVVVVRVKYLLCVFLIEKICGIFNY